jgi:hypothetical protein
MCIQRPKSLALCLDLSSIASASIIDSLKMYHTLCDPFLYAPILSRQLTAALYRPLHSFRPSSRRFCRGGTQGGS